MITVTAPHKGQILQTQPDLKTRLQSLLPFDIDGALSLNTLVSPQDEHNWTALLQAFWTVLQEDEERECASSYTGRS